MKKTFIAIVLAISLGAGYSLTAFSQAKPDTLIKQRQAAMILQGKYFYPTLRPMAQGKIPYDAKIVARNAEFLEALSHMPWDGFTPATRELKSAAAGAVFTDTAKFQEAQKAFEGEVAKLVALTKGGNEAAVKAQILAIDKNCSSCHDTFRERQ